MQTTEPIVRPLEGGTQPLPFADDLTPPTRLGLYEDVRPFALGGMGMICRARQLMPQREVAIKLLRSGAHASAALKERFLREIRLAANLDHPGIVPIFDAGEQDGWLYFVMPLLEDAESLVDRAASQRLDWRARLGLAVRAAEIVAVLHREGLLHRDLKPGNILVDRHGEVRLLDFGLAVALEARTTVSPLSGGGLAGTPAYLSPEQAAGVPARELNAATDVYALGVVTYELLTGHMPYETECSLPEILRSIREARPAAPSSFVLDLPPAVEQVILAALSKKPAHRPADAGKYAAALRRAADGSTARTLSWSAWRSPGRLLAAASAAGLVLLLAAGTAALFHRVLGSPVASAPARPVPGLQPAAQAGPALATRGIQLAAEAGSPGAPGASDKVDTAAVAGGSAATNGNDQGARTPRPGGVSAAVGVVFVDRNATGARNGASWVDACTDLQSALAAADNGNEIWVAAGTYKPTTGSARTVFFQMRLGVNLYGGFTGTETQRTQRNWTTNETVLSGDIGVPGDTTDNSYHVVLYVYGMGGSVLDGFTVTGGMANGSGDDDNGGGVFCMDAPARLVNCRFAANVAANEGGAVFAKSGELVLADCRLVGNTAAGWGGGAVCVNQASFQISGCFFGGNAATAADPMGYAGAVRAESGASSTIADCVFVGNSARRGGAIRTSKGASPTITRCKFSGNHASGAGGAITNGTTSPILLSCTFAGNESPLGGAVANWLTDGSILGCTLVGNVAAKSGGAISTYDNRLAVVNCTLVANSTSLGGGLYSSRNGSIALLNSILWGNRASSAGSQAYYDEVTGGASGGEFVSCLIQGAWNGAEVQCLGASRVTNGGGNLDADPAFVGVVASGGWTAIGTYSVDTGMTGLTCSGAAWRQDAFAGCFLNPDTSQYLQYCVVGNTADTVTILGDCTTFTVVGDTFQVNDYRLRPASPCIDAGLGDANTPATDLLGNARHDDPGTPNTGTGTPAHVDLGAYEFQGTTPAAP